MDKTHKQTKKNNNKRLNRKNPKQTKNNPKPETNNHKKVPFDDFPDFPVMY